MIELVKEIDRGRDRRREEENEEEMGEEKGETWGIDPIFVVIGSIEHKLCEQFDRSFEAMERKRRGWVGNGDGDGKRCTVSRVQSSKPRVFSTSLSLTRRREIRQIQIRILCVCVCV